MQHMKTELILLAIGGSLLLAAPALLAQSIFATNITTGEVTSSPSPAVTNTPPRIHPRESGDEHLLLSSGTRDKLRLTDEQKAEMKQIEEDFAKTSREYKAANQPRIDAAREASRQARAAKDPVQIEAARAQLQEAWAGLQPYRTAAVTKIKPLLTPNQRKILDDPTNQWNENHGAE
jgi:Spy/CpxP family protein refolding chaperone